MPGVGVRGVGVTGGISLAARVAAMFRNSEQGVWYDPSDRATLYQDAAGTTPVTAMEQPVGLILDKSKGLVLGPELVTNGDGSTLSGWTNTTGLWTSTGGRFYHTASSVYNELSQVVTTTTNPVVVEFDAEVLSGANTAQFAYVNAAGATISGASFYIPTGISKYRRVLHDGIQKILFSRLVGQTANFYIDNISVRALQGNHAYQSASTSRPVLSARKNWLVGTETLATQTVTTKALPYVLSFWGTGTITLTGTSTAGPLVGTGADNRVYLEFTPTAGTLTVTVSGTVSKAQLEIANE